jgi:hypothetical protein
MRTAGPATRRGKYIPASPLPHGRRSQQSRYNQTYRRANSEKYSRIFRPPTKNKCHSHLTNLRKKLPLFCAEAQWPDVRLVFFPPRYIIRSTFASRRGPVKKLFLIVALLSIAPSCFAQLTQDQKVTDFKALAGLYDKNYGPYEWKKEVFGFDLLQIQPWLDQVRATSNDLAFYDVCVRYVASLHDSHDEFILPSFYEAFLPLTADIYDNKVLVDFVDNTVLDPATYPFTIGDELVSVNGISMSTWISVLGPYSVNGNANPLSRDRIAVATTLDRYQGWYTYASKIHPGDSATLVIRNQTSGKSASYSVPWSTIFLPVLDEGPVPNPKVRHSSSSRAALHERARRPGE